MSDKGRLRHNKILFKNHYITTTYIYKTLIYKK
jgi:hypothetical protein